MTVHSARRRWLPLWLLLMSAGCWALDTTVLPDPALQARYLGLTHELRCMQCQNEAIADRSEEHTSELQSP